MERSPARACEWRRWRTGGLTREEARLASGYEKGDVVTFRRDYERNGVENAHAYRVGSIDREDNRIMSKNRNDRAIDRRLDRWDQGQSETYAEKERDCARGD